MTIRRVAIAVVMVLVAASCAHLRGGGPGNEGLVVTVGIPQAAAARTVTVTAPRPEAGLTATVWLDKVGGPKIATGVLPLTFTLPGNAAGSGPHQVIALAHSRSGTRYGVAIFNNSLRMNQVQVLGSHNSYHVAPTAAPWTGIAEWQYTHDPLDVQFQSEGIRQIELDVYADPTGIRVLHVPDVDFGTTCVALGRLPAGGEGLVRRAPAAHADHDPHRAQRHVLQLPTPILPWTGPAMDQLDAEIRSVFPAKDVITPDSVRGHHATLAEAVTTDGWPTIDSVRGKVMFVMDNGGSYRDTYTAGHPTLEGREIFTNSDVGRPDAAFIKLNDPIGDSANDPQRRSPRGT